MFNKQIKSGRAAQHLCALFLVVALLSCVLVDNTMAGKNKGNDDIILYNGNIVLRGGKGKGKGGSIVVANSHGHHGHEMMGGWGGMFRRR
jgi:hypothetical protein